MLNMTQNSVRVVLGSALQRTKASKLCGSQNARVGHNTLESYETLGKIEFGYSEIFIDEGALFL
jgi:hypothetical protein